MRVGSTGTRKGMNKAQLTQADVALVALLQYSRHRIANGVDEEIALHSGGQKGADLEFIAQGLLCGFMPDQIVIHPTYGISLDEEFEQRFEWYGKGTALQFRWREVFPPLKRNQDIVDEIQILIAAPETNQEQQRSGTWATVRYARKALLPIVMLSR